ncbi:MAG: hypothetical protein Q7W56_00330 [Candidatus Latescibacteria bacterium]|nr:hypothetical protein [Candidatus Latescibacterota bacterium]
MKTRYSLLAGVLMLGLASSAMATATIGLFFDTEGNTAQLVGEPGSVYDGYVLINNSDLLIGGAAFKMESEGGFMIVSETWADGLVFGTLLTGAEIGLYNPIAQFGDDPISICHIQVFSPTMIVNSHQTIVADPDYDTPMLANSSAILFPADGLTSSITLRPTPEIGVFWDEDGIETVSTQNGGFTEIHNAWIMIRNAEMMVGGAAFKLVLDPRIMILSATPVDGLIFGSLTTGVEIGLYSYLPVFGTDPGLLYTLQMTTFNNLMVNAELQIVNHPNYDAPKVADNSAVAWTANGLTSYLTIPVETEEMSWGQVKSLY